MGRPFHPATPSSAVFIPSIVADHAREAAPLGGAGAERTPSNVTSSPTLAPSGGDKGSTLFSRGGGGGYRVLAKCGTARGAAGCGGGRFLSYRAAST